MRVGAHSPASNHSQAIIVSNNLVKRTFHPIDLLLHNSDDPLNKCQGKRFVDVKAQFDVHDCYCNSPVLIACMVVLKLEIGSEGSRDVTFELDLYFSELVAAIA